MSGIKLHVVAGATLSSAAILFLEAGKVEYETVIIDCEKSKCEDLKKLSPICNLPILETPEGVKAQTCVIAKWVNKTKNVLFGADDKQCWEVSQWLENIRSELYCAQTCLFDLIHGKKKHGNLKEETKHFIDALHCYEQYLNGKKFLVGDALTAADILLIAVLQPAFRFAFGKAEREHIPHITAYFTAHINEALFKTLYGNFVFPECALTHDNAKAAKHEQKAKPVEKKKEEPKKAKKVEADEEEEPAKPKFTPPTSTFNLHNFKTFYVNETDKQKAVDFLFENFDPNAFSVYELKYDKHHSEGKEMLKTSNQMRTHLENAEASHKYSFGIHGIFGEEPDLNIAGVWLWNSTDVLEPFKLHPSYEYYKLRKLDLKNEDDKKLITTYWTANEGDIVDGAKAQILKIFK